ncbi:MAG: TetR/AcrR family transcriptional regulator [Mycobacterium sp.]
MALRDARPPRRRGRPVGSDSAETRNRILRASRQVINERGYQAATFQAIALAAGLSRPTLHYYFASREEIYQALVAESGLVLADCITTARQQNTLVDQFSTLVAAIHQADFIDRSQIAFLVSARLESTRNPELRANASIELSDFLTTLVGDARSRGELPEDSAIEPVVEMLRAMLWGIGFYAGFVDDAADMSLITKQLGRLVSHGLLECAETSSTPGDT